MSVTLKYTGAISPWRELAVTGKQSAWTPGQQEERSNAEASLLLATGYFEAINLPVARLATDPLTGKATGLVDPAGGPMFQNQLPNPKRFTGYEFSTFYNRPASDYQIVGAGSTAAVDTTVKRTGNQTLKVTLNRGSATTTDLNPLHSWTSFKSFNGRIGFWIYIPDYTLVDTIVVKVSQGDATFTNGAFQVYDITSTGHHKYNGWHFVGFDKAEFTGVYGTPDWTAAIGTFRLTIGQKTATATSIYIDNGTAAWHSKGKVVVIADDGYRSWFNWAIPVLDSLCIKSSAGIIAAQVDLNSTWVTSAQLASAYANGHDFAVHGALALDDGSFTTDALRTADILANQAILTSRGYTRASNFYVWPNGVFQLTGAPDQLINLVKGLGFVGGRQATVQGKFMKHGPGTQDMKYLMPAAGTASTDAVATITGYIDTIATEGSTGFLMYHEIVPSGAAGATQRNLSDFVQEMEYIAAKRDAGLIDVVTVSQLMAAL